VTSALGPNGPQIEQSTPADLPECSLGRRPKLRWMSLLGPVALVVAVYWPSVGFDFVNWDDPWYVINNPLIRSWHPANLFRIVSEVAIKNYAPVTMFSYLVDHTLWGDWPGGYHLTNLLLHALNAVLVYTLILQVTESRLTGVFSAALFAVHPVQIESVAWVSSRKGLLSGAFILASLIFWLKKNRTDRDEGCGLLFFALALLSKAIAVVVPFVVLTYDVVVQRRTFSSALARQAIPGFLAVMLLLITMSAQTTEMGGVRDHMELGKLHILAVDSIILWRYVGMLVWPSNLCVLYNPATSGIALGVVLSLIGWTAVVVALVRCRNRSPMIAFAFDIDERPVHVLAVHSVLCSRRWRLALAVPPPPGHEQHLDEKGVGCFQYACGHGRRDHSRFVQRGDPIAPECLERRYVAVASHSSASTASDRSANSTGQHVSRRWKNRSSHFHFGSSAGELPSGQIRPGADQAQAARLAATD